MRIHGSGTQEDKEVDLRMAHISGSQAVRNRAGFEITQAKQRLAVDFFEARHAGERDFQGDRDLPFDLQG